MDERIFERPASAVSREAPLMRGPRNKTRSVSYPSVTLALILASVLVVTGCRKSEQGRVLRQEKGTYQGQPDQALDGQQQYELRQRASRQRAP